jgi:hypothetical protein
MFLPREAVEPLAAIARDAGGTLFMVLLAAFDAMLHRYTGETDILVGTPVRARTRPETENLIGVFVNNVILRMRLEPAAAFDLSAYARHSDAFSNLPLPDLRRLPRWCARFPFKTSASAPPIGGRRWVRSTFTPAASNDMTPVKWDERRVARRPELTRTCSKARRSVSFFRNTDPALPSHDPKGRSPSSDLT